MRILLTLVIILSSPLAMALRKGPIFKMEEIPAQRTLLKSYISYNALRMPIVEARYIKYTSLYHALSESDFDVFKSRFNRHAPNLDFSLAFQNHNQGFENAEKKNDQYGFCLGVTTELRKMNLLAFYDSENKSKAYIPDPKDRKTWLRFYHSLIDQIMSNNPVIIPGFSNLHEFSGTPGIKEYMVKHVLDQWATKNATFYSGLYQMLTGVKGKYSIREANVLYRDVKARIDRHYPPRLFLSKKNYDQPMFGAQYIHVMQAYEISEMAADGSYKIGVWHINNTWDKAAYHIEVRADGTAWMEWRDLGELDIVPGDDAEVAEMVHKLASFCKENSGICD